MQENKSVWYNGMLYGAYLGVSMIILSLIYSSLKVENSSLTNFLTISLLIVWIVLGTRKYRANLGGFVSYSGALGAGVVITLFAGVLAAFFSYIFLTVIEPDTIANSIVEFENNLIENGDDEETIATSLKMYKKFATPTFFAIFAFLGNLLMGFLVSLITSLFLKRKNPNPFANVGDEQIIDSEIK
ncbi:MAG: DUF4199 domain-containing protein [Bacteroidales bacterium]|nr:DUF4199 domain-containing protein [Bacteroidales bacterium]